MLKAKKKHKDSAYLNSDGTFKGGFDGAVKYFMSQGYSKESAEKIAGKIAAEKGMTGNMKKSLSGYSYNELRDTLQQFVREKYGTKSKQGDYWSDYPYVIDVYEDEFVVEWKGKYYIADYAVGADNKIDVGGFFTARRVYQKTGKAPAGSLGGKTVGVVVEEVKVAR